MTDTCTIQLHTDGRWHDVASVRLFGQPQEGWKARTYSGYSAEWAIEHAGSTGAHALHARRPVGLECLHAQALAKLA